MKTAAAFVLVGGRSARMGQDKARLKVDSNLLIEIVARTLAEAAGNVTLVGNPANYQDLPLECIADLRPGLGPLAGLETALHSERGELNLVVACDMPGIQSADLRRLLSVAEQSGSLCTLAMDNAGRRHPLCAVYHRDALPFVSAALDTNRLRFLDLVEELEAVTVQIDTALSNINTPQQWAAWQAAHHQV